MAILARASITLSTIRDISSTTWYYKLQASTASPPAKPTTNPPGNNWVTTEPTYTENSTNSLYTTELTVFTDGTFSYSDVSLSSSYEAAKAAYNKSIEARRMATNYITDVTSNGVFIHEESVTPVTPSTIGANGVHISDAVDIIRNGESVASYGQTARIGKADGARTEIDSQDVEWYLDETTLVGGVYYGKEAITNIEYTTINLEAGGVGSEVTLISDGASVLEFPQVKITASMDVHDAGDEWTIHVDIDNTFTIDPATLHYESDNIQSPTFECLCTYFEVPFTVPGHPNIYNSRICISIVTDTSYHLTQVNIGERFYIYGPFLWSADSDYDITGSATIGYCKQVQNGQAVSFGITTRDDIVANALNSHYPLRIGNYGTYDLNNLYALIIADGTDILSRHNVLTIDWLGNLLTNGNIFAANTSYIGMIIHSTTLSTMAMVIAVYGGTTWIRHSGYFLRGAGNNDTVSNGDNHNVKDDGYETITLTVEQMPSHTHTQDPHNHTQKSHNHTQKSHNHTQNAHSHTMTNKYNAKELATGSGAPRFRSDGGTSVTNYTSCGDTTATNKSTTAENNATTAENNATTAQNNSATATNQNTGGGQPHNNMPPYKNVYIWERTA